MSRDEHTLGYITIKVPVERVTSGGDHPMDPPETYLEYGEAVLIEHDLKDEELAWLGHEIDNGDVTANFEFPSKLRELAEEAQERIDATTPYPENIFITGGKP